MVEPDHHYLSIDRNHRSQRDADAFVLELLRPRCPNTSKNQLRRANFTLGGEKPQTFTFDELKKEARETGTVVPLRGVLGGNDQFFPSSFSMATDAPLLMRMSYAGHEVTVTAPARLAPIETELCDDILFYRRAACESSSDIGFAETTRYYRSYVLSCTALVEAFLNRVIDVRAIANSDDVKQIRSTTRFNDRVALWVDLFCQQPLSDLKSTKEWTHLQELRKERSRFTHPLDPNLAFEIRSLPHRLNLVRAGIGGVMRKLREMQGLPATNFIDRLETAPRVSFQENEDGVRFERESEKNRAPAQR